MGLIPPRKGGRRSKLRRNLPLLVQIAEQEPFAPHPDIEYDYAALFAAADAEDSAPPEIPEPESTHVLDQLEAIHKEMGQLGMCRVFVRDNRFVIPFTLAEYGIRVADPDLSAKFKEMIGDGGALARSAGYVGHKSDKENDYAEFASPLDYANQLRDKWDDLMAGRAKFEELGRPRGLMERVLTTLALSDRLGDGGMPGLVNVD